MWLGILSLSYRMETEWVHPYPIPPTCHNSSPAAVSLCCGEQHHSELHSSPWTRKSKTLLQAGAGWCSLFRHAGAWPPADGQTWPYRIQSPHTVSGFGIRLFICPNSGEFTLGLLLKFINNYRVLTLTLCWRKRSRSLWEVCLVQLLQWSL